MPRAVDIAMGEDRPEKQTMRKLWVQLARDREPHYQSGPVPLYLTLSGAEGRDIELMAQKGIVERTEVGGIASKDFGKIVAVESSPIAEISLNKKFPGLTIRRVPFHNLFRGANPMTWPAGKDKDYCRAHIINLDLDQTLSSEERHGQIVFPVLEWIQKLAQIHAVTPQNEWFLCLTLHGTIPWNQTVSLTVQTFLAENFVREFKFGEASKKLFGDELYRKILNDQNVDLGQLNYSDQQKVLMAFVPKKIAQLVQVQGWRIQTSRNIRYGGNGHAPMVTWIIKFIWDTRCSSTPQEVYSESLKSVLSRSGYIAEDGHLS